MLSEEHISNVTKNSSNQYHGFLSIAFHKPGRLVFLFGQENFISDLLEREFTVPFANPPWKDETGEKIAGLITYSSPARAQFLIRFPIHTETPGQQPAEGKNEAEGEWHRIWAEEAN